MKFDLKTLGQSSPLICFLEKIVPGPILKIVECVAKVSSKQGEITFMQRESIELAQAQKLAEIATNFAIRRNPEWTVLLDWKVVSEGSENSIAFGLATQHKESLLPPPDCSVLINEVCLLFEVLVRPEVISPTELLFLHFPQIEDTQLAEALIVARTSLLKSVGGKALTSDLKILIDGKKAGEFLTRFPVMPKVEPDPIPRTLTGHITALKETSFDFQDDTCGSVGVDFVPNRFFDLLKNRFCLRPIRIELTVEVDGNQVRGALNCIHVPPPGTLPGEPPQLFP